MPTELVSLIDLAERFRQPGDVSGFKSVLRKHFCYAITAKDDVPVDALREYVDSTTLTEQVDFLLLGRKILFPEYHSTHAVYCRLKFE